MATAYAQTAGPAPSDAVPASRDIHSAFDLVRSKLDAWVENFYLLLPNLVVAFVIALLFLMLAAGASRLVRYVLWRRGRRDLGHMLGHFTFWVVTFIGFLVVITIVLPSMRPVDMLASLGVGSVAAGFAFKDTLQNSLAGVLILIRRPFHRGDQIKVGEFEGTVQAVETRATLIKTYNGRLVIIPNSDVYNHAIIVHTAYPTRRAEIIVSVGLEIDLEAFSAVACKALAGIPEVLGDPPPDVLAWEYKNNNIDFRVRWWMKSQRAYEVRTRALVVKAIKQACEEAGIGLPSDTKISFGGLPLQLAREGGTKAPAKIAKPKRGKPTPPASDAMPKPDEKGDPEAEEPQLGALDERVKEMPR
jgi:small-conductance mechanosensitive channel